MGDNIPMSGIFLDILFSANKININIQGSDTDNKGNGDERK